MVLEDNLRVPSGVAYAIVNRRLLGKHLPELSAPVAVEDVDRTSDMLLETLRAAAPARAPDEPTVALLSAGWEDSAWFEHTFLAEEMAVALVQPSDLSVRDGKLLQHIGSNVRPIDVVYARMDEDMLLSSTGYDGAPLRSGLLGAVTAGNLTIANALANGVADDKAIYAYVPAMIEYYLGEKPKLAQVPTWLCAEREQRDFVLANLGGLVVKPIDGLGGSGVLIGPEASEAALDARRRELETQPERFIAQEAVNLSTHPTYERGRSLPASASTCASFVYYGDEGRLVPGQRSPAWRRPEANNSQLLARRRREGHLAPALSAVTRRPREPKERTDVRFCR